MLYVKKSDRGFTLIEIMVGILIFTIVMTAGFQAYFTVLRAKAKLIEKTKIQKNAFYFSEKIFEMIKKGGTIDYEEYFNRKVIGNTSYSSGHYDIQSGFGNFGYNGIIGSSTYGYGYYYCISGSGSTNKLSNTGCYKTKFNSLNNIIGNKPQRYGEYYLQFIDYNNDYNGDGGDHNGDGNFRGDADDASLGDGPTISNSALTVVDVKELYLISSDKKSRTFFRWNVKDDPDKGISMSCNFMASKSPKGDGCLGTIEFLKLDGKDWGLDHTSSIFDKTQYDGAIDTWVINNNFTSITNEIAGSTNTNHWTPLFSDDINVKDFSVYVYPNKDRINSWRNTDPKVNIAPFIRIQMSLTPSWKARKNMRGKIPTIPLNMTISLNDIFSNY